MAQPLAVQDCIVCGKLQKDVVLELVAAINQACRANDCFLIGGETWKGSATSEDALCAPAFDLRDEGVIRGPIFDPYGLKLRDPLTAVAFERSALPDWS